MRHLTSPWGDAFDRLLAQTSSSLVICSPFITRSPCERIAQRLTALGRRNISLFVRTDLSTETMLSGATEPSAAETILHILTAGPRSTREIYAEVQRIHPDLRDDSIRLVIRGQRWNQVKWHHRVRHAQLFLKRQDKIRRDARKWRLVR